MKSGKYEQDFKKGDFALIERVLSPFPSATDTIYLVVHEKSGALMWVTGDDIVSWNQLAIEDDKRIAAKAKVYCQANYFQDLVPCIKLVGHQGLHESSAGHTWLTPHPPLIARYGNSDVIELQDYLEDDPSWLDYIKGMY